MMSIVATIKVKPEHVERFLVHIRADAEGSLRREPGCLRFHVLRDAENPAIFYLFELYRDRAAYEAHQRAPHFQAFFANAADTLDGPPDVRVAHVEYPTDATYWKKEAQAG